MKEININIRVEHYQLDELNTADRELVERALEATNGAYAPYSNFYVGAALRLADGTTRHLPRGERVELDLGSALVIGERTLTIT